MSSLDILNEYLTNFSQSPSSSKLKDIEQAIWTEFGKTGVVCVVDMSGFTKASQQHGIIYYLALVKRMQAIVEPLIIENNGNVVKFEADNCFARFDTTDDAIHAIKKILDAVKKDNLSTPNDLDIVLSIGMDFGEFLLLRSNDYWGDTVNRASKLGEDIAGSGVVLLTDRAWENLTNKKSIQVVKNESDISNVSISTYEVFYSESARSLD